MIEDVSEGIGCLLNDPDSEFRKALDHLEALSAYLKHGTVSAAIGEISEMLIARYLGAEQNRRGTKGYDLVGPEKQQTEVKARLIQTDSKYYGDRLQFNFRKHTRSAHNTDMAYCLGWDYNPRLTVIHAFRLPIPELCERWGDKSPSYCAHYPRKIEESM
jgi:hypothetical protein